MVVRRKALRGLVVLLLGSCLLLGCRGNPNPTGAGPDPAMTASPAPTAQIRLAVQLDAAMATGVTPTLRADGGGTPTITILVTSIQVGTTSQPLTVGTYTATVDESGRAVLTIAAPARSTVAEVTLTAGSIAGFTRFRGALDLSGAGENRLVVQPTGSGLRQDLVARTLLSIAGNETLRVHAPPELAGRVLVMINSINRLGTVEQSYANLLARAVANWGIRLPDLPEWFALTGSVTLPTGTQGAVRGALVNPAELTAQLLQGATVIATTALDAGGSFVFPAVPRADGYRIEIQNAIRGRLLEYHLPRLASNQQIGVDTTTTAIARLISANPGLSAIQVEQLAALNDPLVRAANPFSPILPQIQTVATAIVSWLQSDPAGTGSLDAVLSTISFLNHLDLTGLDTLAR